MSVTLTNVDIGDVTRCAVTFTNAAGVATDPTTVTFRAQPPSGAAITYVYGTDNQLVKDSTGVYHVDLPMTQAYTWHVRFVGTGAVAAAVEGDVYVSQSAFG